MYPIRPWLYIGKYRETLNPDLLAVNKIQAMLQFAEPVQQPGIASLFIPVEDIAPVPVQFLDRGIAFVRDQKRQGSRVLIACGAGINRSSAFAIAALKEEEGLKLLDAFREVKRRHADAMPHRPVWESLCRYYGEDIPYAELTGIWLDEEIS
jgi:protein-tyrosine phosphatase